MQVLIGVNLSRSCLGGSCPHEIQYLLKSVFLFVFLLSFFYSLPFVPSSFLSLPDHHLRLSFCSITIFVSLFARSPSSSLFLLDHHLHLSFTRPRSSSLSCLGHSMAPSTSRRAAASAADGPGGSNDNPIELGSSPIIKAESSFQGMDHRHRHRHVTVQLTYFIL